MALDKQMFKTGTFLTNDDALVEVRSVRVLGPSSSRRRVVTVEDSKDLRMFPLTEAELKMYHVVRGPGQSDLTDEEREHWVNPTRPGCKPRLCPDAIPVGM